MRVKSVLLLKYHNFRPNLFVLAQKFKNFEKKALWLSVRDYLGNSVLCFSTKKQMIIQNSKEILQKQGR